MYIEDVMDIAYQTANRINKKNSNYPIDSDEYKKLLDNIIQLDMDYAKNACIRNNLQLISRDGKIKIV